ncbi:DMT family transporter [Wenxinia marina]|uniref:Membrane transporter n=1 Tax=Wenxinia marina DSM 24838 TaxID=1123501 RepID=A0A0D0QCT8_9RHOB|nr:SMR family transporter [Wenxinia marina]KIQ68778.1 Membrane transporter [Wenxinia marina DSM 24838]GGL65245.1 multidrug transporter [Wenxinia marina]
MPATYLLLLVAVVFEVIATSALQSSRQFTRLIPSLIVVCSYATAFYLLSLTLKTIPVGVMYAIWSGLGIVLIAVIGMVVYGQRLDLPAVLGLAMILGGILVIHLFSRVTPH